MDPVNSKFKDFVQLYAQESVDKLLLSFSGKCEFDLKLAVSTIEVRRRLQKKVPEWAATEGMVFPNTVSAEQCSSYITALFKQRFFNKNTSVFDLTGGLGVDSYYISKASKNVIMCERDNLLSECAEHNFRILGAHNIVVENISTSESSISGLFKKYSETESNRNDIIAYIDPSRRGSGGERLRSLRNYEPDLIDIKDSILKHSGKIIAKISPMEDISELMREVKGCKRLHIVSVHDECKEIILEIDDFNKEIDIGEIPVEAWNYTKDDKWESVSWTLNEEREIDSVITTPVVDMYLYEPNSSIMKGGAYKVVANRYSVGKADKSSHIYFSDKFIANFPGRIFLIEAIYNFNKKCLAEISSRYPRASISTRNFPLSPVTLRNRLKINEGEKFHIFGTTLPHNLKKLIVCSKI